MRGNSGSVNNNSHGLCYHALWNMGRIEEDAPKAEREWLNHFNHSLTH